MGEIIKFLRLKANMTQEELGKELGVQKAAIMKYEKGLVENIKRSTIEKMSILFQKTPSYIMGFEEIEDKYKKTENLISEDKLKNLIQLTYGKSTLELLNNFQLLDELDKTKIIERTNVLLEDEKYNSKKGLLNA